MRKVAVVLSGCGHMDGSEITESVLALVALSEQGLSYRCFAPSGVALNVMDHLSGKETGEKRDVMTEAARIARGNISPLSELKSADYDALLLPGGFGVAKNLSNIISDKINPNLLPKEVVQGFYREKKPIVAVCIAPALVAFCLRDAGARLTLGAEDADNMIASSGSIFAPCAANSFVADERHRIITTPAFMQKATLAEIAAGIRGAVAELGKMLG
jgi:enhancing lycopene biosynthesis protein 2